MNRTLKVTFVMPRTGEWPSGGFRIIYEHANYLSRRGHHVTVVHPGRYVINPTPVDHLKNTVRYLVRRVDGRYTPDPWLAMDPRVRFTCVPSLSERFIPEGDAVIATAWQTAELVSRYPASKGRGFYFIQHLETWNGPDDRVFATWKMPLHKIVPSRWLVDLAAGMGEQADYIPYGLDFNTFRMETSSAGRRPNQLMMLYHNAKWKGCDEGLEALHMVRQEDPDMRAILFGVPPRPATLPEWISYHQSPSPSLLRELYNQAAIFASPSRTEGWGLTGCEALLCGAALAATDIDGHREFAFHEKTALTSPARSPRALADNILRLMRDTELRLRLAANGREFLQQFTWERASSSLEKVLTPLPLRDSQSAA